jgi:mannose-6-phosphate isomerase-like protein (cupin superfamily)
MKNMVWLLGVAAMAMAVTAVVHPAAAQPPPLPTDVTFASSADIAALIAKARADHKDDQPTAGARILQLSPYNANLEYRTGVGPAAVHETEAELFYVLDGSGTLITGGKLVGEKRLNPQNLTGTGVTGGMSRAVAKGDLLIVPENTPHWFSAINGTLVMMSLHVPRPVHP